MLFKRRRPAIDPNRYRARLEVRRALSAAARPAPAAPRSIPLAPYGASRG